MKILRLDYSGYRNLQPGSIEPDGGINVIYGKNAQGKTNLLEAMWLFTGGRSFRGSRDADLIGAGERQARLDLHFFSEEREQAARILIENGKRSATLNEVPKRSAAGLIGSFCAVIFSPEHLSLVREGPAFRRNFIDSALCQIQPSYAALLTRYNRTLIQRNSLLKDIPRHAQLLDTLEIWDEKLVRCGMEVVRQRIEYIRQIGEPAEAVYAGICEKKESLGLNYLKSAENLKQALYAARVSDIAGGHTSVGPHRDDLEIQIDGRSARAFGSQGQKRSAVLALKLAEAEILRRRTGEKPVVLLDDVMSELDSGRQDYLLNHLENFQVFLTCCEPDAVKRLKTGRLFEMSSGRLEQK
ncbi:MAG TPA: DNA replication/repair protein RecF [Clostridia bacterium]|nr:DNA replication/repair protein RecF [Clostridia bacterium]